MPKPVRVIDRDAPASVIAEKFGGTAPFARELGRATSTVHVWIVNGRIPPHEEDNVVAAGERHKPKIRIKPIDFVTRRASAKVDALAE